jgi:uncharacterized protein (TIGR03118 family)
MQRRRISLTLALPLALIFLSSAALAQFQLTNLSSNQVGHAHHDDPLLVNGWGIVHGPGTPWWVSDNNSGWSTLYDSTGAAFPPAPAAPLRVLIPTTGNGPSSPKGLNGPGSPTGVVFNATSEKGGAQEFKVEGWSSIFLFATLDGTISGWAPQSNLNEAIIAVDNGGGNSSASYTGLAITNRPSGNLLFAADMAHNKVDVYSKDFALVNSFTDSSVPAGFAVFGIQDIDGFVYVTFAATNGGPGGFVDKFTEGGTLVGGKSFIKGAPLNQPWGIALAPATGFGKLSNTILVSNNTNTGTINAFNRTTGTFVGTVKDVYGKAITIDQLWGIGFGDGMPKGNNGKTNQLFFAAGPSNNVAGTFGVISPVGW